MKKKIIRAGFFRRFDTEAFILVIGVVLIGFIFFLCSLFSVAVYIMKHHPNG